MAKPPSLSDVARAAGLSPATVSRYLNRSLVLPAATSERIDEAIAALAYRPNPHARSLSRGKSDTIGLVIPEIANPFFANLAAAVEGAAERAGLGLMLCSSLNRLEREIDYINRMEKNFVDGLLFSTNHADNGELAKAINSRPNIVLLDEGIDGARVPGVFSDNLQGGEMATRYIIEAGHRHLAYIGGPHGLMSANERALGFRQAIAAAGLTELDAPELFGDYTVGHGARAITHILDHRPDVTAVFVGSDEILVGALGAMRERGKRVGEDLSIVTFDDAGRLELLDPPITAVRQSVDLIAATAVAMLVDALNGVAADEVQRVPVELIVRSSVVPPRIRG